MKQAKYLTVQGIKGQIYSLPNTKPFMLAGDLAEIYEVKPRRIGEAVRRNPKRFPTHFAWRLPAEQTAIMRSQNATALPLTISVQPLVFSHAGANMLSAVLKSEVAAERSIIIMEAFSAIEEAVDSGKGEFAAGFALGLKRGLMLSELFEKHSLPMSILGAYCYHRQHGQSPAGAAGSVHISAKKAHAIELAFQNAGIRTPGTDRQPSPADARKSLTTMLSTGQPEVPNDHQ